TRLLDRPTLTQQVDHLFDSLSDTDRFSIDHQVRIARHIIGEGLARDVVAAGSIQALGIALLASQWRSLDVYRDQAISTYQHLGLFAALGIRCDESRKGQQTCLIELASHVSSPAPVLSAPGTTLRQALVQVMAQVLAVQHVNSAPHVEQLALDRVSQGALAGTRQAGEQHGSWLLAETCGTLFGGNVSQRAMMIGTTLNQRI